MMRLEMADARENLAKAIEAAGVYSMRELSLGAGKNETYLYAFINKHTPRELPEDVTQYLAKKLGMNEEDLMSSRQSSTLRARARKSAGLNSEGDGLMPIYGREPGTVTGPVNLTTGQCGETPRPGPLLRDSSGKPDPNAFAVLTTSTKMSPAFNKGDILYINTIRPARAGDHVLIVWPDGYARVRELVDEDSTSINVATHKPRKMEKIKKSDLTAIFRIDGSHRT